MSAHRIQDTSYILVALFNKSVAMADSTMVESQTKQNTQPDRQTDGLRETDRQIWFILTCNVLVQLVEVKLLAFCTVF